MNKRLVLRLVGMIMLIEAMAMVPSLIISLIYRDGDWSALFKPIVLLSVFGLPLWRLVKPESTNLRAKEGVAVVAVSWFVVSLFGALPFVMSGFLPNYIDAVFEAVSGFTTTGATMVTNFDNMPHGITFWRSFTHWIGGMGVLVFSLALIPQLTGRTNHLVRAESAGPSMSKIAPRMSDTAKILYSIYGILTLVMFVVLLIAGMSPYDAAIHAMGTAGTGGFSNYGASVGAFGSVGIEIIITVFMILFGVNFTIIYYGLNGKWREVLRSEELRWFLGIVLGSMLLIAILIMSQYGSFWTSLRYSSFQVASILSTTGFATADYNLWPQAARTLIMVLMFVGSCAGSTAGGVKIIRVAYLCKLGRREIRRSFQPRSVRIVRFEGKGVDEGILSQTCVFFFMYVLLVLVGAFVVSLDGCYDLETNFTAALTCVSNVGPGLGSVGPVECFAGYSYPSKMVLTALMLCGRLEIMPILALFSPAMWHRS